MGRLADLGFRRAPVDLDSLRRELEAILDRELAGAAATGADARGIPFTDAELARAREALHNPRRSVS